jgi:hypothetical protein
MARVEDGRKEFMAKPILINGARIPAVISAMISGPRILVGIPTPVAETRIRVVVTRRDAKYYARTLPRHGPWVRYDKWERLNQGVILSERWSNTLFDLAGVD